MWEKYYLNKREHRIDKLMWVLCKSDDVNKIKKVGSFCKIDKKI